jgi:nucleotide-binding universal stress UspA family protein
VQDLAVLRLTTDSQRPGPRWQPEGEKVENKSKPCILIPVDFSAHSEAALVLGCKLAHCFDARPLVLHVVHDPGEMPGYYAKTLKKKHLHRIEDGASHMLDEFLQRMAKNNPQGKGVDKLDALLVKGLPVSRILEVAQKHETLMIVMGSKGKTGIKHLLIGSVAERVMQLASVPVTVTKIEKK